MRRAGVALLFLPVLLSTGCSAFPFPAHEQFERWGTPSTLRPPITAPYASYRQSGHGHLISEVNVFGYTEGTRLHFSLTDETPLATLLDVAGGLPKFGGRGRVHLGMVRAHVSVPGGEGYAYSFKNVRRREALCLLADVAGKSIIVGPDVNDTIDVEISGAPPSVVLRLLADEGGVIILEDESL